MADNDDFVIAVERFAAKSLNDVDVIRRRTTLALFNGVVLKTPVDTGRARGNWQATVRKPAKGVTDVEDKNGTLTIAEILKVVGNSSVLDVIYLTNNLPYILTLEYGGYPNPVKYGTRVGPGRYEQKSEGGFSRQAPKGMVRVTLAEFYPIVRKVQSRTVYGS